MLNMLIGNVMLQSAPFSSTNAVSFVHTKSKWILDIFVFHLFIINSEHMTIENKYRLSYISQQYWSCKVSSVSYKHTILVHPVSSSVW